jgi:hypothetical protein
MPELEGTQTRYRCKGAFWKDEDRGSPSQRLLDLLTLAQVLTPRGALDKYGSQSSQECPHHGDTLQLGFCHHDVGV